MKNSLQLHLFVFFFNDKMANAQSRQHFTGSECKVELTEVIAALSRRLSGMFSHLKALPYWLAKNTWSQSRLPPTVTSSH